MYLLVTLFAIGWMLIRQGDCDGCGNPKILCCSGSVSSCKVYGPSILDQQALFCFCDSYCEKNNDCCIDYSSTCSEDAYYLEIPPYNGSLKQSLSLNVNFKGTLLNLDLQINPDIPEKLPRSISIGQGTYTLPRFSSMGVYNDKKNKASMVVKYIPSNQEPVPHPVMGSLIKDGQMYTLYPAKSGFSSDVTIEGVQFFAEKEDLGDLVSVSDNNGNINQFINSIYQNRRRKRQVNLNKKNYFVELLIISDLSIHLKYANWCNPTDNIQTCKLKTNDNIENYLFLIINLVSLRYFSIINDKFLIRIKAVKILTSSSNESISFIENDDVIQKDSRGSITINGTKALKRFALQITNNTHVHLKDFYGTYDHAIILTDYKIVFENLETQDIFTGTSIFNGMCKFNKNNADMTQSISIVRNRGLFSVVAALSHQLAHSMRVPHDNITIGCSSEDQYLMAPFIKQSTQSNSDNINYFSSCSKKYFETYFLSQNENFCLSILNFPNITKYTYPSNYDLDQYCFLVFGDGSRYCQGNYLDICNHTECWDPKTKECVISDYVRAIDGMDCGFNKKCAAGACQMTNYFLTIPSLNQCYFDDYIASFTWDSKLYFYCADISLTNAYACYNSDVQKRCCKKCYEFKIKFGLKTGCEYGNREPANCNPILNLNEFNSKCYYSIYEIECCVNCQKKSTIPGCQYGDKENWCKSYADFSNCNADSTMRSICCYTCSIIITSATVTNTPYITTTTRFVINNTPTTNFVNGTTTPTLTYTRPTYLTTPGTPKRTTYTFGTTPMITRTGTLTTPPIYNCPNGDIWSDWCAQYADKTQCQNSYTRFNCCVTCSKYF